MKVGDMVRISHAGGSWVGLIVELLNSPWAVVWRPEQGFQTWPMFGGHPERQFEVINESW